MELARQRDRRRAIVWIVAAGAQLVAASWWLRVLDIRYLAAASFATLLAAVLATLLPRHARSWATATVVASGLFCSAAAIWQRDLANVERSWTAYRTSLFERANARLRDALTTTARMLGEEAESALDAPANPAEAFRFLERTLGTSNGHGVLLIHGTQPYAWAGRLFVPAEALAESPISASLTTFYVTLNSSASRGRSRAVATAVIHAEPPADMLAPSLSAQIARNAGLRGFEFLRADSVTSVAGAIAYVTAGDTLFWVRAIIPDREEALLNAQDSVRYRGVLLLAVALVLFVAASWRGMRSLPWRLVPLGIWLACLGIVPLNMLSGDTPLFDPTVYFTSKGGPFTSSVGTLAISGAVLLLALLVALRGRMRLTSRPVSLIIVLVIMASGPFFLRALSRGVAPSAGGVQASLWLAWEISLFLAAASLLVAAIAAGGVALGSSRGAPPVLSPLLATIAALLGPLVLRAPGLWPAWYPLLWIVAIGALAVTRRHRSRVLTAASVAALGATTLTWNAGIRGRVALADRDVSSLAIVEPHIVDALERYASILLEASPPRTEAELLRTYMRSDLAGTGFPVSLLSWTEDGSVEAEVALAEFRVPTAAIGNLVSEVSVTGAHEVRTISGELGRYAVLAVPHPDASVTTVVVAPRTRLIADDPYNELLGLPPREIGSPPYVLSLTGVDSGDASMRSEIVWYRSGNELHGHRAVETAGGRARAHIEMPLRSLDSLVPRGTLVVLLDMVVIMLLWLVSAFADGALLRWARIRVRGWATSYRARLTVALFAFFVIPAMAFAAWSYRQLLLEQLRSGSLLLSETLRTVAATGDLENLAQSADSLRAPLLLYRGGSLDRASSSLIEELAPAGRFLSPDVYGDFTQSHEVQATRLERIGSASVLFGYRFAEADGRPGVLAIPARDGDVAQQERSDDLAVLVLFTTVVGALAALSLSGIAARSLAQPIGRLRTAALAIAAGEREPPLAGEPPVEFVPVFSAFRRMAADLGESRSALVTAQRRTAAVLRNVASGVIALDRSGVITLANPQAETLLDRPIEPGLPAEDLHPPEIAKRVRQFLSGPVDEEEFDLELDDRRLHARLARLAASGGGCVLTLDDLTDLARAQRVIAWGEMARQVAHEIKNPLTPIRLGVQHLKRARADARPEFDDILNQNVQRILMEIDHLDEIARSFSRYGTLPAERLPAERTDVAAAASHVVELERIGGDHAVDWSLTGNADRGPLYAFARDDELREVLLNVLENARQAQATRVIIAMDRADGSVVIEIRDDGKGIPAHVLPRIFEPHFSTSTSGSGLGLAISRQLIEGWGGEIAIASEMGNGTIVRIKLKAWGKGNRESGSGNRESE